MGKVLSDRVMVRFYNAGGCVLMTKRKSFDLTAEELRQLVHVVDDGGHAAVTVKVELDQGRLADQVREVVGQEFGVNGEWGFCGQCGRSTQLVVGLEDRLQRRTLRAVERRGKFRDWSLQQLVLRQITRLCDGLARLASNVHPWLPPAIWTLLDGLGPTSRWHVDRGYWADAPISEDAARRMLSELADVQVVTFCLAEMLGQVLGEPVDICQMAVAEVEQNIARGVRSE